jgi:hypothetical protein
LGNKHQCGRYYYLKVRVQNCASKVSINPQVATQRELNKSQKKGFLSHWNSILSGLAGDFLSQKVQYSKACQAVVVIQVVYFSVKLNSI